MDTYNKDKLYDRQVNLYLEANPNPNSMKFVVNFMLLKQGEFYDFPTKKSAKNTGLAEELFKNENVVRVFIMSNFITITKVEEVDWLAIREELKTTIQHWLEAEKPTVNEKVYESNPQNNESEDIKKIKEILEQYIQPAVEQDGGAISFYSFEKGVVKVLLQGACSGCPSSTITLKQGIEGLLSRMMPNVKSVEAHTPDTI